MGHAIVLFNDNRIQRFILERDGFALVAMNYDRLCGGFLHLEPRGGRHFGDGKLTWVELFPLLMQLDLTIGVRKKITIIRRGGSVGSLSIGRVCDMELRALNRSTGDRILFEDGDFRAFPVPEHQFLYVSCVEANGLHAVSVLIRQIPGCGYGNLRYPVCSRGNVLRYLAVSPSGPIVLIVAVDGFYPQHGAGNRLLCIGINFREGQFGFLQVLKDDFLLVTAV